MTEPLDAPLRGTTIIDASRMLPGGVAARMLADLGARVIKVEEPSAGDPMRAASPKIGGIGAAFCAFYRGAESLCLDLKRPADVARLERLVARADVLLESFRPGTLAGWGLGPERLLAEGPRLVVCSLSSFGQRGPRAGDVAHDINLVAWSGLLSLLPGEGLPRVQLADVAGGMLAVSAILAALLRREKTGQGAWVDQPLARGPLPFLTLPLAELAADGPGIADVLLSGVCPAYRLYMCGDGSYLAVGALEPKFWNEFVNILELPELANRGIEFGPAGQETIHRIEGKLAARPRDHWLSLIEGRRLPVAPVARLEEAREALTLTGLMENTPAPGGSTLLTPGPYVPTPGFTPADSAPALGQHTASIIAEFALD